MADAPPSHQLNGKVAIITGSSAGIGAATAVALARLGAHVVLTGRNVEGLKKVTDECTSANPNVKVLSVQAELTKEEDVAKIFNETKQKFGRLDILVNNAGTTSNGGLLDSDLEDFDKVFQVNLRAVYQLTQLCAPLLMESKGNIVNVSSIAAMTVFPSCLNYSMTKAALDHFTRYVAMELASHGVRCNGVNPGVIKTDIFRKAGLLPAQMPDFYKSTGAMHALDRVAEPEEVASAIVFLATGTGSFVTGVTLPVDGGAVWYRPEQWRQPMVKLPDAARGKNQQKP